MRLLKQALIPDDWRKASYSLASGECVEIASDSGDGVVVRDSKDPAGPVIHLSSVQWRAFLYERRFN